MISRLADRRPSQFDYHKSVSGQTLSRLLGILPDRHPFKVSSNSIDLTSIDANLGANIEERVFSVVKTRESISVAVIGKLYFALASSLWPRSNSPWSSQVGIQANF